MTNDRSFDVIVVGAGAAGLYAALCLPQSLQVGLISKEPLSLSASDWAQGGIAAAIAPDDSPELHIADTLKAGAGLCEPAAVRFLAEQAPACIQALVDLGVAFDHHGANLALTLEAAHSRRRVLHAADTTGRAVVSVLAQQVIKRPNIQVLSPAIVIDLWIEADRCHGVYLAYQQRLYWLQANAVILATGGGGQVFAHTTNPALSTGDGVAMAWRSGAWLRDLEFVQFHPTALAKPGAPHFLISEAVRGEGAHLLDHTNHRFAFDYHAKGELAPRDVVSRAIFSHLQQTGASHVWLDLRPIAPDKIQYRFPNIIRVCQAWGVDVFREPIPVSPAAHYWMGGVAVDHVRTSIPGLYAVGEVASTGVHGANRLASNSLLECIVFGACLKTEMEDLKWLEPKQQPPVRVQDDVDIDKSNITSDLTSDITVVQELRSTLPELVWQSAGICRTGNQLTAAIDQVAQWRQVFANLALTRRLTTIATPTELGTVGLTDSQVRLWSETRNLLDISYLILESAAFRTESRGGHFRSDYPTPQADWQVHTLIHHHHITKSPPIPMA
ncbi:MAG: L-aspartate oxidase [Cyanobacteria bacterium]|nr:L-aspartate oxidase [Cyanobacteriota bacterium]MDW8201374.1 L-aspartate oxidase [Cyanobacteriota bacterium SKYGB_h_bin112]